MRAAIICHDKPDALPVRPANRASHLAYIEATGVVDTAGPLLDAEGRMTGSLIVLDVPDIEAARAWAAAGPYALAGLFASVTIAEWRRVIG